MINLIILFKFQCLLQISCLYLMPISIAIKAIKEKIAIRAYFTLQSISVPLSSQKEV